MALEALTLYKLVVLYMLGKVQFPLTNTQISEFFLESGYTTYFSVQSALSELIEDGMITVKENQNTSYYYLTDDGRDTSSFFRDRIPSPMMDDVDMYLLNNKYELRNEVGTLSDCYQASNEDYTVHCMVKEGDSMLIELHLSTPDREIAEKMCAKWKEKDNSQKIYQFIMDTLTD